MCYGHMAALRMNEYFNEQRMSAHLNIRLNGCSVHLALYKAETTTTLPLGLGTLDLPLAAVNFLSLRITLVM